MLIQVPRLVTSNHDIQKELPNSDQRTAFVQSISTEMKPYSAGSRASA